MDVTRHFGDYAIGVYGVLTDGEHNAGFHFAIPMMGKRQKRNGRIRLRMPEYFNWEYSMVSNYRYANENMGREYTVRADENRSARYFQAEYIEQSLQRYLKSSPSSASLRLQQAQVCSVLVLVILLSTRNRK